MRGEPPQALSGHAVLRQDDGDREIDRLQAGLRCM